jgi:C_GCAxxG_C_C family probable redox protein
MTASEDAIGLYKQTFTCSQAVCAAFGSRLGLDRETALKISCAFGGGCSRLGLTCGAVTGAFMVIGLKHGRSTPDGTAAKEKAYSLTQEFAKRFVEKNGSLNCTELLGCDLGTDEGYAAAKEKNLFTTLCLRLVKDSAGILEELLESAA